MKYCAKCGHPNNDESVFCVHCGSKLKSEIYEDPDSYPSSKNDNVKNEQRQSQKASRSFSSFFDPDFEDMSETDESQSSSSNAQQENYKNQKETYQNTEQETYFQEEVRSELENSFQEKTNQEQEKSNKKTSSGGFFTGVSAFGEGEEELDSQEIEEEADAYKEKTIEEKQKKWNDNQHFRSILIDPSEKILYVIGAGVIKKLITTGKIANSGAILTNRRMYYYGKTYYDLNKNTKATDVDGIVPIEDITFSCQIHKRNLVFLILGILIILLATFLCSGIAASQGYYADFDDILTVWCMYAFPGAFLILLYFFSKRSVFQVSFPGGIFTFNIELISKKEVRAFQRELYKAKDRLQKGEEIEE